jgi:(S)-3,5-dihydroxyphenylglycine transaminase
MIGANTLLKSTGEDVMGFLNEIQLEYPDAISLASGRPDPQYFDLENFAGYVELYINSITSSSGADRKKIFGDLGQYNRTKGIVNDLLAKYLETDEQIRAAPEDILVTVGTQEAMTLAVFALCNRENDVILTEDPTYVGLTHLSKITGHTIEPIPVGPDGICLDTLEEKIISCRQEGKRVAFVYVIPDYQNPTGCAMPVSNRQRLLDIAEEYDTLILEDNAYGDFAYDTERPLTLKAMDINNRVIYMRSFSKTLYPSLRVSALVAGQVIGAQGEKTPLSNLMAKIKGYITVNTSAINQAILGGILIKNNCSLLASGREKVTAMKSKRDQLLAALTDCIEPGRDRWAKEISWNIPQGGFFLTIKVPFKVTKADVIVCARQYKVIFTPMSFFYLDGTGGEHEIRLAFSNVTGDEIRQAVDRLSAFLKDRISVNLK